MIDFMESMASFDPEKDRPKKIEHLNCGIHRDTAHCTYTQEGEDKSIILIKRSNKWLVELKKETPDYSSLNADSANVEYEDEQDTTSYFDFILLEAKDVDGSAHFVFKLGNRSEFNILHLWVTLYFSDKNGTYLQKKEVMFNGILKDEMYSNISNSEEIKGSASVEVILENANVDTIGEVFIYPFRLQMEMTYYDQFGAFGNLANLNHFAKRNTLVKDVTDAHLKISF